MKSYRIAMVPGDGVGPEISLEAERVLKAAAGRFGFGVETEWFDWSCDRYLADGAMMPDDALDTLSRFDSIFSGASAMPTKCPTTFRWACCWASGWGSTST